jgi:hypothetical protein
MVADTGSIRPRFAFRRVTLTLATPSWATPIRLAAASDRSRLRPLTNGPRSLTLTTTELPVERLVTRIRDPRGKVLDAAVKLCSLKTSPLVVRRPLNPGPYHEALTICDGLEGAAAAGRDVAGG